MNHAWMGKARRAFRHALPEDERIRPALAPVTVALRKECHRFVPPGDPRFRFEGTWRPGDAGVMIAQDPASRVAWTGPVAGAVPVLARHPFSGVVRFEAPGHAAFADNHASFPSLRAFPLAPTLTTGPLEIAAVGRNPLAQGQEIVLAGIWLPMEAAPAAGADPAAYAALQTRMVDDWLEDIRRSGRDVEEVSRARERAYLGRWAEVLPYAPPGTRVLDLGGGFAFPALFAFWHRHGIDYTGIDIDHRVVDANRAKAAEHGLPPERFLQGINTRLDLPDGSQDLVFSSHCLEHTDDLPRSFAEIRRVLRPDGHLVFAVPAGVDTSPEHTYFFSHPDWVAFAEAQGFAVMNQHIGRTYPESGFDLLVVARLGG